MAKNLLISGQNKPHQPTKVILPSIPYDEELYKKALRRIRISPRQSIALAKGGSVYDMEAIMEFSFDNTTLIPAALQPTLFEVLCSHIRNIDSGSEKDINVLLDLADLSLHCLEQFDASFMQRNPKSVRILRETWPSIFIWLQRVVEPELWHLRPSQISLPNMLHTTLNIAETCDVAGTCGGLQDLVGTDEFFDFVTRMWLRDEWESKWRVSESFFDILSRHSESEDLTSMVGRFISQSRLRTSQAFVVSLTHLRSFSNSHYIIPLVRELDIIKHLLFCSRRLRSGFIRAHGMNELIRTLHHIDTHPLARFSSPHYTPQTIVSSCFSIIVKILDTSKKAPFLIKESIKRGLFKLMLQGRNKCWFTPDENGYSAPLDTLERLYPPFYSIPSIALRASRAVKEAMVSSQLTIPSMEHSKFAVSWSRFNLLLAENMLLKALLTQRRKRLKCDNPDCSTVGNKKIFQTCASCKSTIYCSYLCQKAAWKKHGHRELCKAHRHHSNSMISSNSDRSFIKGLAMVEISRHAKHLFELAMEEELEKRDVGKEDLDLSDLVIGYRVDFVPYPPSISLVCIPDECFSENDSDQSEFEYRRLVLEGDHRGGVFIEIRVPTGAGKYETVTFMGDLEKPSYGYQALTERPGRIAEVLRRGQSAGGIILRVCTGSCGQSCGRLEAEYGEVDELLRRLVLASMQTSSQLLDEDLISSVVDRYIADIQDSTLGLYS